MTELDQTEDRLTLAELFRADGGLEAYTLHEKYRLSPGQIFSAMTKLEQLRIAKIDGSRIQLTAFGLKFAIARADLIWGAGEQRQWRSQLPNKYADQLSPKQALYCPRHFLRADLWNSFSGKA
jgi:hypothetical protein